MPLNAEKIRKLQEQASLVRTGGKGTARRKKKIVHKSNAGDANKIQTNLKKLHVTNIPGIEEVNMIKDDGTVINFNNPKVQASVPSNTFSIEGHGEDKKMTELLPGILNQLGPESLTHLKSLAETVTQNLNKDKSAKETAEDDDDDDEDVPELVENFDEASKTEESSTKTAKPADDDENSKSDPKEE